MLKAIKILPWRDIVFAAAAGGFLALAAPLGTHSALLWERVAFWIPLLLTGTVCARLVGRLLSHRDTKGWSPLVYGVVICLAVSTPMSLVAWAQAWLLFGARTPPVLHLFSATLLISATMTALFVLLRRQSPVNGARGLDGPSRFATRLPEAFRELAIHALEAKDHRLIVHMADGQVSLLMRLSDAVVELQEVEGAQVHRSWWVARRAIIGNERVGRSMALCLAGGLRAPVSRPNVQKLKERGWI